MNWLKHPIILEGDKLRLIPMERTHFAELERISAHPQIWEHMGMNGGDTLRFRQYLESAVIKRAMGEQYPFTVIDKLTGGIIGSTMFHSMYPEYRKLEIGYTWYHPAYWRTGHNRECKLLQLTYCFEVLNTIRVQLVTDANNSRSRAAIEGIGAMFEGVLRHERIRHNGEIRNTAMYSITDIEWPDVKTKLVAGQRHGH